MNDSGLIYNGDPFVPAIVLKDEAARIAFGGGVVSNSSPRLIVSAAPGGIFGLGFSGNNPGMEFRDPFNNQLGYIIIKSTGVLNFSGKDILYGPPDSAGPGYRIMKVPN